MLKESIYLQRWYAEEYDQDRYGGAFGRFLHDQEVETFLSMTDGSNTKILDVGSGSGKLSIPLMKRNKRVIAIDSSLEMLKICRKKAKKEGINLESAICDAHHLCFRDNAFECVVSSRLLMHLNDWRKGLAELCRVSYGVVIVDFPPLRGFSGLDSFVKKVITVFNSRTNAYKAFPINSVKRELQKHNFRVMSLTKRFFLPLFFHRKLNSPWLSMEIERLCRKLGLLRLLGAPVTVKAIRDGYRDLQGQSNDS